MKSFQKVLALDPGNEEAKQEIENINKIELEVIEQEKRKEQEKEMMYKKEKIFLVKYPVIELNGFDVDIYTKMLSMNPKSLNYIVSRLVKMVYGSNEFEKKRDENRANIEYDKLLNSIYKITFNIDLPDYDFNNGGYQFPSIKSFRIFTGDVYVNSSGGGVIFTTSDTPLEFPFVNVDAKKAENIKKMVSWEDDWGESKSTVKIDLLIKFTGGIQDASSSYYNIRIININVIDARIKTPTLKMIYSLRKI